MLQLRIADPRLGWAVGAAVIADVDGVDAMVIAVAAACAFDGAPLAAALAPVERHEDELLVAPGDLGLPAPGTDVLLAGNAYAPGSGAREVTVELSAGPVRKRALVRGPRVWQRRWLGWRRGAPAPFARQPLTWRAAARDVETNPVGVPLEPGPGAPLPSVASEDGGDAPCGFGPVAAHWAPRRRLAGTYDDAWSRERAPFVPLDFDPRFLRCAPADQQVDGRLAPGTAIRLRGCTASGDETVTLPQRTPAIELRVGRRRIACVPALDVVAIDAEARTLRLLWRAAWRCGNDAPAVDAIEVAEA